MVHSTTFPIKKGHPAMSISEKFSPRDLFIGLTVLALFVVMMLFVYNVYRHEGDKRSAEISDIGEKDPNHIEAYVKILSVDPIKGDMQVRLEFVPKGNLALNDDLLARPLKLFVNSSNGKQETEFAKGKRMNAIETVVSMYDGLSTDYPFDSHSAFLEMYLTAVPDKKPDAAKPAEGSTQPAATPVATPAPESGATPAEPKKEEGEVKKDDAETDNDVSLAVDFYGSVPGFKIGATKTKDSDDDYVGIDMTVARSGTVVFFSAFVMFLMWGATIAVLLLVLSVILRGRKIEVGMFSFLAALIFALIAVRNAQPGIPPIGTFSDFVAFFWAEVILSLCLLTIIFTWLFRPAAK
jgi:hypothetical protein